MDNPETPMGRAFSRIPLESDPRVSAVLTHCLSCDRELPEPQSTCDAAGLMILFTQCPCGKAYMLDLARFS